MWAPILNLFRDIEDNQIGDLSSLEIKKNMNDGTIINPLSKEIEEATLIPAGYKLEKDRWSGAYRVWTMVPSSICIPSKVACTAQDLLSLDIYADPHPHSVITQETTDLNSADSLCWKRQLTATSPFLRARQKNLISVFMARSDVPVLNIWGLKRSCSVR